MSLDGVGACLPKRVGTRSAAIFSCSGLQGREWTGRLRRRRAARLGGAESAWRPGGGSRLCPPPRHAGPPPSSPAAAPAAWDSRVDAWMDALASAWPGWKAEVAGGASDGGEPRGQLENQTGGILYISYQNKGLFAYIRITINNHPDRRVFAYIWIAINNRDPVQRVFARIRIAINNRDPNQGVFCKVPAGDSVQAEAGRSPAATSASPVAEHPALISAISTRTAIACLGKATQDSFLSE
jgi:hypothetical protein